MVRYQRQGVWKRIRMVFSGVCLFCLLLIFTGCGGDEEKVAQGGNPAPFTDFDHIEQEYLETLKELDWPEGTELPTKLEGEDEDMTFQQGYGNTRASYLWQMTWEKEWLDSYNTDPERADRAIEELEKAFDMGYMSPQRTDDATRRYLHDHIDQAKLGDPSGFEQDLEANGLPE